MVCFDKDDRYSQVPKKLEIPVAAYRLNAAGKTIGIISHVAVLKERIPTQFQGCKLSGGYIVHSVNIHSLGGSMLSVKGIYEDGQVRLLEKIPHIKRAKVIVTVLEDELMDEDINASLRS